MYSFLLWREFKLSIAEINAVFPEWKTVFCNNKVLVMDDLSEDDILSKASRLWWTIKICKVLETIKPSYESITSCLFKHKTDWKFTYWVSLFWVKMDLKKLLLNVKKYLRSNEVSSRFINKDFKNLNSAQIISEKLIKKWSDFSVFMAWDKAYFTKSIFIQDIDSYSDRDYSKWRDMQIWMLPPKLSQIMINLSWGQTIYDPFVWLWTVLIESIYMWNKLVLWSDLNQRMVEVSSDNLSSLKEKFDFDFDIFNLNAKFISERTNELNKADAIVTEWYLWEVMTQKNISMDRIEKQKDSLEKIYEWFFAWLSKSNFSWKIVISFPFWELNWEYKFCDNIYSILENYTDIHPLNVQSFSPTKMWSLLYKREKQLVWREVFLLWIK